MSQLSRQLKAAYAHIQESETITRGIPNAGNNDYERVGLKDSLGHVRAPLTEIKPEIVNSNRRTGEDTSDIFERHVTDAQTWLETSGIGVFARLSALNKHFGQKGDTDSVLKLERLRKEARKINWAFYLMLHRRIAFLLSWRFLLLIIVAGLIATCAVYVKAHATATSTLTPTQNVTASVASGVAKVQAAADSGSSTLDGGLRSVKAFLEVIGSIPTAILTITSSIAAVQALILAVKNFKA